MRTSSIRRRLTLAFILVAAVPLLLVGVVLTLRSFNVLLEQATFFETTVAQRVSTEVTAFIKRMEGELKTVANTLPGNSLSRQRDMLSLLPSFPETFEEIALLDREGVEQLRLTRLDVVAPSDLKNWADNDAFTIPKTLKQTYYGTVETDPLSGEPSMLISVPIPNVRSGIVDQVLIGRIRFKPIWDLLGNISLNTGESVYITDSTDRVIAHRNPSVALRRPLFPIPSATGITRGLDNLNVVLATNTIRFGDASLAEGENPDTGNGKPAIPSGVQIFNVIAERNSANALDLLIQTAIITGILLIVALLIATTQGILAARRITQPIQDLAQVAQELTEKSESFDPKRLHEAAERTDEIGQFARVFQTMGQQVVIRETTLKKQVMALKIEIDEQKKQASIKEIVDTEYFKDLESKAASIRAARKNRTSSLATDTPATPATGEQTTEKKE
ncbi:MAG: HAMP domain-containing protein [Anaerolineales bacterium]|nr:HAMP domain-containing protein [Anaerolineales bacterium]